ncbi:MAG: DegT/DnrJ/EryC1/StrS family aminotransferase, partial [Chloroflexota bacterium]
VAKLIKVSRGCLGDEELAEVREAFAYGYFGHAAKVEELEAALAAYLGAEHVVATNTGTSALHLALAALGIGEGDEVLVPSLTFVASFQAIRATGATPVPCDVQPDTLLMDLEDAAARITPRTRALMPVHYAGAPCDLQGLRAIASRHGLRLVEDAAHAFGSTYQGRRIGSFGDATCFSFDSIKNITCGEGGAVACGDRALADLMRRKRTLGIDRRPPADPADRPSGMTFEVATAGFRYHMSNINAAIGLAQLRKADAFIARRREICRQYDRAFSGLAGLAPLRVNYDETAPHIYVIRVKDGRRDALMRDLREEGIETGINYVPNHLHPLFRWEGRPLPETERAFGEILTLPLHVELTPSDVAEIIERVRGFVRRGEGERRSESRSLA